MSAVSDNLNSQSDIYYFNVFVDKGNGIFKLPYTSMFSEDISVSFRKLEYMPYKVDGFSNYVKNLYRYGETRKLDETVNQPKILDAFLGRMKELKGVQIINVVSFYNYNSKAVDQNDELFCADYVLVTNDLLSSADNLRLLKIINANLKFRGSDKELDSQTFNFLDITTYPDWLSKPDDTYPEEKKYNGFNGIMFSSYRLKLNFSGQKMGWLLGNIDTTFKIRTDSVMEAVINVDHAFSKNQTLGIEDDCGFAERLTSTKYRGLNFNIYKGCLSSKQVVDASEFVGSKYVVDAFSVVGNLMIHFNRILMNDTSLAIDFKTLMVDINLVLEGSPFIVISMEKFKNLGDVNASIYFNSIQKIDKNLDLQYIRITSPQAFRSAVLSQNKFNVEGVLYQGTSTFQTNNPYLGNFVTCHRPAETNELTFTLRVFSNSNFQFGSEVYEDSSGLLVGELVILHSINKVVDNFF